MIGIENPKNFRHLILFSLLSGKNLKITQTEPFYEYQLIFLDLINKLTIGTKVFVLNDNKRLDFKPGSIEQKHS